MPAWKACRWGSANAAKCPTPEDAGGPDSSPNPPRPASRSGGEPVQPEPAFQRQCGLQAREALEALLGHPIGNLRKEAALALGELADPASAQALRVAEGDGDPEVRKAVRIALAQLRMPA